MKDIDLLRFALACIWTELEKDAPDVDGCQQIANEALEMTVEHAKPKRLDRDGIGVEAWKKEFCDE